MDLKTRRAARMGLPPVAAIAPTSMLRRSIVRVALGLLVVAGGVVAFTGPATAATHTCSATLGASEFIAQTTGARVCYYVDTFSFKICDTAADGHHPAVLFRWSESDGTSTSG
jgi:hypothetical protein